MPHKPRKQQISFKAFSIKFEGLTNRIITNVKLSQAFDPNKVNPGTIPLYDLNALWDTGATKSVITKAAAEKIGLVPTGVTTVNHAGGTSRVNTYFVNVILPNGVGVAGVSVSECPDTVGAFEAIVGMDIIVKGDMSITNVNGNTCMSFRVPSIKMIDYVIEANRITFAGTPKYAPCPCGKIGENGRHVKFRDCHGKEP